jgi:glycosyltransferase involved in cell wall biosynthesis
MITMEEQHMLNNCIDVLLVGRFGEGNGNNTTASRIRSYLYEHGWSCQLKESNTFANIATLNQFIIDHNVLCIIGIHAFHAGKLLRGVTVPYCIIFGGTDINEYSYDDHCRCIMSEAVSHATILVAFSPTMLNNACKILTDVINKKVLVIPQGVVTKPTQCTDRAAWLSRRGLPINGRLFTMIAGLRPVKDPLFLVSAFTEWHQSKCSNAYLVIVGPQLDEEFSARFLETIAGHRSVIYVGTMPVEDTHRLITHSFAVVNSSIGEGMSVAILEAMDLGIPVIARDIPGNSSVVENLRTGLLYSTPKDFIKSCELLLNSTELRETLVLNARLQVQLHHSSKHEKEKYVGLVAELMQSGKH